MTLLEWCEDAIDFRDESDERAAEAFENLMNELVQVAANRSEHVVS